jgi:23S rRNA pseudouridine1911/1915/1917 synthase
LKHIGLALAGDSVYGKPMDLPRQMLHAWRIGFRHPVTGEAMRFTAPLPADFVAAIPASSMPSGLRTD